MNLFPVTAALAATGMLLSGCVSYKPAPIDGATFVRGFDARGRAIPSGQPLDASSLMALALAHAPSLRDTAAAYRVADAAARSARVRPLGTLTLTAEYSHQDNPNKPWLGGAALGVPLDMGARRSGRIGGADLSLLQARYDYVEALWTARTAIERGLIELRAADDEIVLDRQAVDVRRDRERRFERRVAAGEDARSTQLLARTDRIAAEKRLTDAEGRRRQAAETLASAIGLPGSALADHAVAPVSQPFAVPDPQSLASWRGEAALARPDVLRAIADYDIAEAAIRTEVAKQYPDIQIGPGYIYERGVTKLPFSLSLSLPPSDLNRAAIREAEVRRAAAGAKLETVQANVLSSIDTAQAGLVAAVRNDRRAHDADVPAAARALEQAKRSADAGESDRTEELAARAALLDARIAALDARRVRDLARVDLDAAIRPPLNPADREIFQKAMQTLEPSR